MQERRPTHRPMADFPVYPEVDEGGGIVQEYAPFVFGGVMLIAAFAFAGAFIESWGRITDNAMWRLMAEASERLAQMLELKQTDSNQYEAKIRECYEKYCRTWRRE